MTRPRRMTLFAVTTLLAGGLVTVVTTTDASAYPTCDTAQGFNRASVPSVSSTGSRDCVMGQGAQSAGVRALQYTINECYIDLGRIPNARLAEDGQFGSRTRAALVNTQRYAGTSPDGVYGPKTRQAIQWRKVGFECSHLDLG